MPPVQFSFSAGQLPPPAQRSWSGSRFLDSFPERLFRCIRLLLLKVCHLSLAHSITVFGWSDIFADLYVMVSVCPNPSDIGTYVGQGLAICSFGALAGTPINGALIRSYGYLEASMFSAAMVTAGLLCQIIARFLLEKRPWTVV